jgi:hypothetical protein
VFGNIDLEKPRILGIQGLSRLDNTDYLLLREINSLTDDEAIEIAGMVIGDPINRYKRVAVTRDFSITGFPYIAVHHSQVRYRLNIDCTHFCFEVYDMESNVSGEIDMKQYAIYDYLRSIGIALPVTFLRDGKPYTMSVKEQIDLGYIKLKP